MHKTTFKLYTFYVIIYFDDTVSIAFLFNMD